MNTCKDCKYFDNCGNAERVEPCDGYTVNFDTPDAICARINANNKKIEKLTQFVCDADYIDERRNAETPDERRKYRELARENANATKRATDKIYRLKIVNAILRDNHKYAVFYTALPLIIDACAPYNGKSYGEKTREKIRDKMRENGYTFYIDHDSYIHVAKLDAHGCCYSSDYVYGYTKHGAPMVTSENKLNVDAIKKARISEKYTPDVNGRTSAIIKAYRKYCDVMENAERVQSELNALLPSKIDHYSCASRYVKSLVY